LLATDGRLAEGVAAAEESVALFRPIAARNPVVFRNELAAALSTLSACQDALGLDEAALQSATEVTTLGRQAAVKGGQAQFDFGLSLKTLLQRQTKLGRWQAALTTAEEAVSIWRALTASNPFSCGLEPTVGLMMKGVCLKALGRLPEAAQASAEAIAVLAPIFHNQPAAVATTMRNVIAEYIPLCKRAGGQPDMVLLGPIVARLRELDAVQPEEEKTT
jgi:tetratricopeptide (TPR) repeat protein